MLLSVQIEKEDCKHSLCGLDSSISCVYWHCIGLESAEGQKAWVSSAPPAFILLVFPEEKSSTALVLFRGLYLCWDGFDVPPGMHRAARHKGAQ